MKRGVIFFLIAPLLVLPLLAKYHPEIKWREISQKNFIVIYPEGYEAEAANTLQTAQTLYQELLALWGNPVPEKIRILLTDVYDSSNGSATFFPFNQVTIYLFIPSPDSVLGNCRHWIRLVLSHELTHIFNFNSGSKGLRFLRTIFGHNPFLYPINFSPIWMKEGMAVYGESKLNPGGRLNTPDYKIILENMARVKSVPRCRDIYGEPTFWPGPESKYLFGSKFMEFLKEKYGEDKIPELVHHYAKDIISISSSFRFKQFFKKWLSPLWNDFRNSIRISKKNTINKNFTSLTRCGMSKKYPLVIGQDRGVYVFRNYENYPGIWEINLKNSRRKKLLDQSNINGMTYSQADQKIYFSATDYFKSYYKFSNLYEFNLQTKHQKRLSWGKRLSYPVKLPNTQKIFCVKRKKDKSYLAIFDLAKGKEEIISKGFDGMSFLSLSPDHQTIAVSLKRRKESWRIALFNLEGKLIKFLVCNDKKNYYPQWKNNHELYFITEHKQNYCLAMVCLKSDRIYVFNDNGLPAIRYFSLLPDQNMALLTYFDASGYDLGLLNLSDIKKEELTLQKHLHTPDGKSNHPSIKGKKYNTWRDILPKYLNFNFRYAGNEIQPGIFFSGNDVPSRHSFLFQGFYGFITETINLGFNYTYEGLYPTIMFNYTDYSDLNQKESDEEYVYSAKQAELVSLFPLIYTERLQSYFYSNIHFETIIEQYDPPEENFQLKLNGIKLGFLFNSSKRYYDSFSQADGVSLALAYSRDFEFLGSDFDLNTVAIEYKQYITLFRPNVLAMRIGISDSWGQGKRFIYMGGADSKISYHIAGGNMFNLMRGYPSGYFTGIGGFLLNLEYRLSLTKMEKSIFLSQSVERFYLSVFADIGNMWENEIRLNPAYSLGAELNIVLFLGERVTVSGGVAIGRNPYHEPIFYLRIGESF